MTPAEAKKIVIISAAGTAVLSAVGAVKRTGSTPARKITIGAFVAGVALAGAAEFAPEIAAGVAALMLVTSLFVLSGDAMSGIAAITQ